MSQRPRLQYNGAVYHVMSRGVRKCLIFVDDEDRRRFFATLGDAVERYRVRVDEACQMGTHFHLVLETPEGNLSQAMQYINTVHSQAFNRRHGYTGHLFEARFRSPVVQRESYLRRACRYVVLNPVRGKLTAAAADWPWSTYRATAGLEEAPPWLNLDWLEAAFDCGSRAEAQEKYRQFVNNRVARKTRINENALILGDRDFKKAVVQATQERLRDRDLPLAHRSLARPDLVEIFTDVRETSIRDNGIYTAHVAYGYYLAEIARFLELDRSTVSRAFQRAWNRHRRP